MILSAIGSPSTTRRAPDEASPINRDFDCTPLQTSAKKTSRDRATAPGQRKRIWKTAMEKKHDTYVCEKNCTSSLDLRLRGVVLLHLD